MIHSFLTLTARSFITSLKNRNLIERTTSNIPNTIKAAYVGFDPTATSLHIGNLQSLIALSYLWREKVQPIIVLGGTTGSIGDPSGRDSERQILNLEVINSNLKAIRSQIEGLLHNIEFILDLSDLPQPIFINNKDIYENMSIMEFMKEIGRYVRVSGLLNRETIKRRLNCEEGISYQEFSYQLFQAYDFLWLNEKYGCNLQLGGSDQWGNICAGCELIKKVKNKEVFGVTSPLLVNAKGEKYGKSMVRVLNTVGQWNSIRS